MVLVVSCVTRDRCIFKLFTGKIIAILYGAPIQKYNYASDGGHLAFAD
jgi:hypothetical protein